MAIIFSYGVAGINTKEIDWRIATLLLILPGFGIVLAASRTATIMCLPGVFYIIIKTADQNPLIILPGILTAVVSFFSVNYITGGRTYKRLGELIYIFTGDFQEVSSLQVRFANWQESFRIWLDYAPFGTLVSHGYVLDIIPDSLYVSTLLQSGVIGVVVLLFLYFSLIISGISEMIRQDSNFSGVLVLTVTTAVLIGNITTYAGTYPPSSTAFWIMVGIVFATYGDDWVKFASRR
jgi:cell division protein FtsW (lipid II flippase)